MLEAAHSTIRFLCTIWYCLVVASSEQGLQHALDRFSAECYQVGMKINTEVPEVLCLSRKPSQCTLHLNGNTLQQVEIFK